MVFDIILVVEDESGVEEDRLTLKAQTLTMDVDRKIQVYTMPSFKGLTELLGDKVTGTYITDWGKTVISFNIEGVINEGTKYASANKMMEFNEFVKVTQYLGYNTLLYGFANPATPTTLSSYALRCDNPAVTELSDDGDTGKGIKCKITKVTFTHTGNTIAIMYKMNVIAGKEFNLTGSG